MENGPDWSPDEPLGTESFEAWDEALDAEDESTPGSSESPEGERSLDTQLFVDEAEVEEANVGLDDPELLAVLPDGADDPDGAGARPTPVERPGDVGWELDAGERVRDESLDQTPE
jgi:hypothetical protein